VANAENLVEIETVKSSGKVKYSRPFVALLAAALLLIFLVEGCEEQRPPLKVARHIWPGYEFMFLAEQLGKIDPEQVQFVQTNTAPDTLNLLFRGEVDGGALTLDEVLRAHDKGLPLVAVLVFNISAGADVLIARPEIGSPQELGNKRIGVETGAVGAIMLDRALEAGGLDIESITVVPLRIDEQVDAWRRGDIDAVVTYEPNASLIQSLGGHEIFSSRQASNLIVDVLAFRPEAMQRQEQIQHLVDAHFSAQKHFFNNEADTEYRLSARLGVSPDQVISLFDGLVLPDRASNHRLLNTGLEETRENTDKLIEIMQRAQIIKLPLLKHPLFDGDFVEP